MGALSALDLCSCLEGQSWSLTYPSGPQFELGPHAAHHGNHTGLPGICGQIPGR